MTEVRRGHHYQDLLPVLLTALEAASVEEVDDLEEVTVWDVGKEDWDRVLLSTPALAAGEGAQQGLEVSGVSEDKPVDGEGEALFADEDHVRPPLRSHCMTNVGDQQSHVMVLLHNLVCRARHINSHHLWLLTINLFYVSLKILINECSYFILHWI